MSYYRSQLESWLKEQDIKTECVIDIGGQQMPVNTRTRSFSVKKYQILDLPKFNIEKDDNEFLPFRKSADIIFCLEVFEYLINPIQAMRNIASLLKTHGTAYISVPLVYPVHNEVELDSLRYTEQGFKRICAQANMKARVVRYRKTISESLVNYYAEDKMHPARKIDHNVTGYIFLVRHETL